MKIRHEDFDHDHRIHLTHGVDRAGKMIRASVFQVIARHRCDDDVFQAHPPDRLGHPLRLILFQGKRFRSRDGAEAARARAAFPRDHHRRRALAPAFPAIWTLRAFTNGVEAQIRDERFGREEDRIRGRRTLIQGGFFAWCSAGSIFAQDIFRAVEI